MRAVVSVVGSLWALGLAGIASASAADREVWTHVPMPPGFKVVSTELEGPVFADSHGKTLYKWPIASLRNGYAGDPKDKSACGDKVTTKTGGYMSPYPPGLDLPDLDKRKSCVAEWAPVMANDKAKPVGDWTVITREDGTKQWAYDHHALYTSYLDHSTGDVMGGTEVYRSGGDTPAERMPVGPPPDVPPGFTVETTVRGRMLLTEKKRSIYTSDKDGPNKSNCTENPCTQMWEPVVAPASAQPHGEWSIVNRSGGVQQWAFRKKPLYTYTRDQLDSSLDGTEETGWHNVYTQLAPTPPKPFTVQATINGDVLADGSGMTVYFYTCGDDSADQLSCDTLDSPQEYRLAICGGGDAGRCDRLWHYVPAAAGAKGDNHVWSVVTVDPKTGHAPVSRDAGALRVWAYRGRPVYTYAGDKQPGDYTGHAIGEWQGRRNGYRAFWIRSELFSRS